MEAAPECVLQVVLDANPPDSRLAAQLATLDRVWQGDICRRRQLAIRAHFLSSMSTPEVERQESKQEKLAIEIHKIELVAVTDSLQTANTCYNKELQRRHQQQGSIPRINCAALIARSAATTSIAKAHV